MTEPTPEEPTDQPPVSGPGYLPLDPAYGSDPGVAPPPYPPPPGYGPYPPPYGVQPYGAPGYPQNGITSSEDTTWAMLAYLGQFLISFIAPLIVYVARKDQSPFCRFHGAQALNLAITDFIVVIGGIILGLVTLGFGFIITFPAMLVYGITGFVYLIIATVKANQGEMYVIPKWLAWPMVK